MPTTTICIPSTCISEKTCGSSAQQTFTAHQIARAAVMYNVDEIVIYNVQDIAAAPAANSGSETKNKIVFDEIDKEKHTQKEENHDSAAVRLAGLLQYFVTPSYLRNALFNNLKPFQHAKRLSKIPGLPYLDHNGRYIEGMAVRSGIKNKKMASIIKKKNRAGAILSKKELAEESNTDKVNIGSKEILHLEKQSVPVGARVTVDLENNKVVSPQTAYGSASFGYNVRIAKSFGKVFTESIYPEGYSFTAYIPSEEFTSHGEIDLKFVELTHSEHLLLVYGKWTDLLKAVEQDKNELEALTSPEGLFDGRLDIQRGARTEDVVLISLGRRGGR